MILSGEIEVLPVPNLEDEDGEYPYGDEEGNGYVGGSPEQEAYEFSLSHPQMNPNVRQNVPLHPPSNGFEMSVEQQQMMHRGPGPMVASPNGMAVENPALGMMYNGMGGVSYPNQFPVPDLNQTKWGPGANINEQEIISSLSRSDVRRSRNRAMSASSSGSGSSSQMGYYEPGWNTTMAPNMGTNVAIMSGGGSMGNNGAAFAIM
jgi:hypothetical protein